MSDLPEILQRVADAGFAVFSSGRDYDLNIVGLRNPNGRANQFDDLLFCIYQKSGEWKVEKWTVTTDPGFYWLANPSRAAGTAVMMHPQQCRSVYALDKHNGKYTALCQRHGSVKVWRDGNLDQVVDYAGRTYEGNGINIHRGSAHGETTSVDRYSAGCTVFQNANHFRDFIALCILQVECLGYHRFTYTLLEGLESDYD
jgi:hypothetical protein